MCLKFEVRMKYRPEQDLKEQVDALRSQILPVDTLDLFRKSDQTSALCRMVEYVLPKYQRLRSRKVQTAYRRLQGGLYPHE
jgi:hypothetical protein